MAAFASESLYIFELFCARSTIFHAISRYIKNVPHWICGTFCVYKNQMEEGVSVISVITGGLNRRKKKGGYSSLLLPRPGLT